MDGGDPGTVTIQNRDSLAGSQAREVALDCVRAGIEAAHPRQVVQETVSVKSGTLEIRGAEAEGFTQSLDSFDEVILVGGGKAAVAVAVELESLLGDRLDAGVVVAKTAGDTEKVDVIEAGHPIPDAAGIAGAERIKRVVTDAGSDTLVIGVITGGASSLLPLPVEGVELSDIRAVTRDLLEAGVPIEGLNTVRKHLSALKGGRLAEAAAPATVGVVALSDVVGDDMGVIGSGPFSPDSTTYAEALDIVRTRQTDPPDSVLRHLEQGADGEHPETPPPGNRAFDRVTSAVIATNRTACVAAADAAESAGYQSLILSSRIQGEAREAAMSMVGIAEESVKTGDPTSPPAVLVSGGETTVTVSGGGTGGPNQEFAVAAGAALEHSHVTIAGVDTDGTDGPTNLAGGIVDANSFEPDLARQALDTNDVTPLLEESECGIRTGPTGTNVNDLRVIVVDEPPVRD